VAPEEPQREGVNARVDRQRGRAGGGDLDLLVSEGERAQRLIVEQHLRRLRAVADDARGDEDR